MYCQESKCKSSAEWFCSKHGKKLCTSHYKKHWDDCKGLVAPLEIIEENIRRNTSAINSIIFKTKKNLVKLATEATSRIQQSLKNILQNLDQRRLDLLNMVRSQKSEKEIYEIANNLSLQFDANENEKWDILVEIEDQLKQKEFYYPVFRRIEKYDIDTKLKWLKNQGIKKIPGFIYQEIKFSKCSKFLLVCKCN